MFLHSVRQLWRRRRRAAVASEMWGVLNSVGEVERLIPTEFRPPKFSRSEVGRQDPSRDAVLIFGRNLIATVDVKGSRTPSFYPISVKFLSLVDVVQT